MWAVLRLLLHRKQARAFTNRLLTGHKASETTLLTTEYPQCTMESQGADHIDHEGRSGFYDVSGIRFKREHDRDRHNPTTSSITTRSLMSPWEVEFPSTSTVILERPNPLLMSSFTFSEGGGMIIGTDRLQRLDPTPDARFTVLEDTNSSRPKTDPSQPNQQHPLARSSRVNGLVCTTGVMVIMLCLVVQVTGLVIVSTPWFARTLQPAIAQWSSRSISDRDPAIGKLVFLMCVGLLAMVVASTTWIFISRHRRTYRLLEVSPPYSMQRLISSVTSWLELLVRTFFLAGNIGIFVTIVAFNASSDSTEDREICRRIARAFGYNALFSTMWVLPLMAQAGTSTWSPVLALIRIDRPGAAAAYRRWLVYYVALFASLHVMCLIIHVAVAPATSSSPPATVHLVVTGAVSLVALVLGSSLGFSNRDDGSTITVVARHVGTIISVVALCLHCETAFAWLLPSIIPVVIHQTAVFVQSRLPITVLEITPLPNRLTRIVLMRSLDKMDAAGSRFTPGQIVFLNIPSISWLHWRPSTIASSPSVHAGIFTIYTHDHNVTASSSVAHRETWATRLHEAAIATHTGKTPPRIFIDGFYGRPDCGFYEKYDCLVFVAGGTGVLRLVAILEELYHHARIEAQQRKVAREQVIDTQASAGRSPQIWVVWTSRDATLFTEFEDVFSRIRFVDPYEQQFHLRFFMTKPPSAEDLAYLRPRSRSTNLGESSLHSADGVDLISIVATRPFQQPLGSLLTKVAVVWGTVGIAAALSIPFSVTQSPDSMEHFQTVALVLVAMIAPVAAITLANQEVQSYQRRRQERIYEKQVRRDEPTRSISLAESRLKLQSFTTWKAHGLDTASDMFSISPTHTRQARDSTVLERLAVQSMRPDLSAILRDVASKNPCHCASIGVFASGSDQLKQHVQTTATEVSCDSGPRFDVHRL